jgi:nicotinamidase-related amidase
MSSPQSFRQIVGVPASIASPKDSALIIIDAQGEYADGKLKVANIESTREAILSLINTYRSAGAGSNIVHITHQVPDGAPVFTPGTSLAEELKELRPQGDEKAISKQHPGSFTGTDLESTLKSKNLKKVVLTGYMAHVCVSTTARQAAELGYEVVLPRDAIGDRDIPGASATEVVAMSLAELADAFATVVSSDEIK